MKFKIDLWEGLSKKMKEKIEYKYLQKKKVISAFNLFFYRYLWFFFFFFFFLTFIYLVVLGLHCSMQAPIVAPQHVRS